MSVSSRPVGALALALSLFATDARAALEDLLISEIDPDADVVEIWNAGPDHTTTANRPFCFRFDYVSVIPSATTFLAGEYQTFTAAGLDDGDSDMWLYRQGGFANDANILNGAKYGPQANVGRTNVAVTAGIWPATDRFAPAPPPGSTLAFDGFGLDPADWYVDETPSLGAADVTTPGTVPPSLGFPGGTQSFEAMSLGDLATAIDTWVIVNSSSTEGIFTVRAVNDVFGDTTPRGTSTRWLRIRDQEAGNEQNRFYSGAVVADSPTNYTWTFHVNLEAVPPGGGDTKPRLTIQHDDQGSFSNAWGIEFSNVGAALVVTGIGGPAASSMLYPLASPTGVGDWVKIQLTVDFANDTVTADFNDEQMEISLPISLAATADPARFRFCYRGEGAGNVNTMLLDDINVTFEGVLAVDEPGAAAMQLLAPVPNPTTRSAQVSFSLAERSHVALGVYDANGRLVRTLLDEPRAAGAHTVSWDGRTADGRLAPAGVYFARLDADPGTASEKLLIVR